MLTFWRKTRSGTVYQLSIYLKSKGLVVAKVVVAVS